MREADGLAIDFMMQVDVLAPRVPGFVEKAAKAGCVQVFIGMETVRDDNLEAGGKRQNKTADYREMIAAWHRVGVVCHVGYIIGFPNDTYQRVMEDVKTLRDDLLVDQASFFMLTPLPGSKDHQNAAAGGVMMERDYNRFDAFHATTPHPRMSREEWERAFEDAWTAFYSFDAMRGVLLRQNPHTYWGVLKNLIWYRAAMIERAHPMVTGFFRLKDRRSRRPGLPREPRVRFAWQRMRETVHVLHEYARVYVEMQDLWLQTRIRRDDYAFLGDLRKLASRSMQDVKVNWASVHAVLATRLSSIRAGLPQGAPSPAFLARLEAVRQAIGTMANDAVGQASRLSSGASRLSSGASRLSSGASRLSSGASRLSSGASRLSWEASRLSLEESLADLRVRYLPPLRQPSWVGRAVSRANIFSMRRLRPHPQLHEYLGAHLGRRAAPAVLARQPAAPRLAPGARQPRGHDFPVCDDVGGGPDGRKCGMWNDECREPAKPPIIPHSYISIHFHVPHSTFHIPHSPFHIPTRPAPPPLPPGP